MSSPHPRDDSPREESHHHDRWLGHLTRLGLLHSGIHLPFSKIFLSLLFVGSTITAILLMAALFGHWADRRDSAIEDGQADARAAAAAMDEQLREIVSVAEHTADFDLTEGRNDVSAHAIQYDADGSVVRDDAGLPIINEQSIESRLKQFLTDNPGFWGVGACFERSEELEPHILAMNDARLEEYSSLDPPSNEPFSPAELYCPYFTRPGGEVTFTPVPYDYADPDLFLPGV